MATASKVLQIAAKEIGYSRWTDPQTGTKYGRWYAQKTNSSYFGMNGVPYCAMFVAWVLDKAGQSCPGMPTAAVLTAYNSAKRAGIIRSNKKDAQPGDLVIFNWGDGGKVQDHIGFVEKNYGSYIQTIEGNTSSGKSGSQGNGGGVYRRTRNWSVVYAVIKVPYTGSNNSSSSTTSPSTKIDVDGDIGPKSVKAWQVQRGCKSTDGFISKQPKSVKPYLEKVNAIEYVNDANPDGSALVGSVQTFLKKRGFYTGKIDCIFGPKTVLGIQTFMRKELGYKKHALDSKLGYYTACNIQNAINAGAFKG